MTNLIFPSCIIFIACYLTTGNEVTRLYKKKLDTVQFSCYFKESETKRIWTKNDMMFRNSNGFINSDRRITFRSEFNTETITITEVKREDRGNYSCIAKTSNANQVVKKYMLIIIESVKLENYTRSLNVLEGETARLWCNATSVPPSEIQWFIDTPRGKLSAGIQGPMLGINDVRRSCINTFVCEAVNPKDPEQFKVERNITVNVKYPPEIGLDIAVREAGTSEFVRITTEITDDNQTQIRIKGTPTIRIMCEIVANPHEISRWIIQNQDAATYMNERVNITTSHKIRSKLEFMGDPISQVKHVFIVQVSIVDGNEFGVYTCRSNNGFGFAVKSIQISKL